LADGLPRHYLRINPTDPDTPDPHADPNTTTIQIANGGGRHPARNVVGGDFLHLVRFGIRSANDPIVRDSVAVIDRVLKHDLPQGRAGVATITMATARRKTAALLMDGDRAVLADSDRRTRPLRIGGGSRSDALHQGAGEVCQPGRDDPGAAWDADDLPGGRMKHGVPTGAAMPLCWSHAEYVSLVRSRHDGVCFDRVEPAFQRYVANPVQSRYEIWSLRHPLRRMPRGKILRIILAAEATIVWSTDDWSHTNHSDTNHEAALNLWFIDFPTEEWPVDAAITFTCFWKHDQRWEGRNWQVSVL